MANYFDHSSSPLYSQISDVIRERIVKEIWPVGDKIPTLPSLSAEFGVGIITVRQAIDLLKNEGLLDPMQGLGTFVIAKPEIHPRMKVESSLVGLAKLYREYAPRLIPLSEGFAMPKIKKEDGLLAPKYRLLKRIHAGERQLTSVISAYIDDRIFKLAPRRFRQEVIIPVLMDLKSIKIKEYATLIGIRADEPRRVAKISTQEDKFMPLARQGITEKDVWDFWNNNSFDLELPKQSGSSNCDLCFLKGTKILASLIQQKPSRVEWWAKQEEKIGARFAKDRPTYAQMGKFNDEQSQLFIDETIPCFCGD